MRTKIVIVAFLVIVNIFSNPSKVKADSTEQILEEHKSNFGISDFIKETEKYGGEFLEDIDILGMLNDALTGKVDNNKIYKKI